MSTRVFPVRLVLRVHDAVRLEAHHAAVIYATLAEANQRTTGVRRLPPGVLLLAPEQCRVDLHAGELYAFGLRILAANAVGATERLSEVHKGLTRLATETKARGARFRGNFAVAGIEDLVTGDPWPGPGVQLNAIPESHFDAQAAALERYKEITLSFDSPLLVERPDAWKQEGHQFFDRTCFVPEVLLRRARDRLNDLDLLTEAATAPVSEAPALVENRLVWLNFSYGSERRRKRKGGAVGRLRLSTPAPGELRHLVMSQYVHVGQATRFGFGRFRILEAGPDPFACRRSHSLLELALEHGDIASEASRYDLDPGVLENSCRRVLTGSYVPRPHRRVVPRSPGGAGRVLEIPHPADRALQRLVLARLAPGLDGYFETASMAYRKGFGRLRAPGRIRAAWRHGYRWALKSDFARFFDSIPHAELEDRLSAYVQDPTVVDAVMMWIRAGVAPSDTGLPTGAPLSPLLANLFLDRFDEEVAGWGAVLVRYADDFVILTRTREEAETVWRRARKIAAGLLLSLNDEKTAVLDLREPFDFLGFRFAHRRRWRTTGGSRPRRIEDLGWKEAPRRSTGGRRAGHLPGEQQGASSVRGSLLVVGPEWTSVEASAGGLLCTRAAGRPRKVAWGSVRELLVLGDVEVVADVRRRLLERGIPVVFARADGRTTGVLTSTSGPENAHAIVAQVREHQRPEAQRTVARALVAAKLRNHAALLCLRSSGDAAAVRLHELAAEVEHAEDVAQVRGFEGAGAGIWFRLLPRLLPKGYSFPGRVAPDADDPVNMLMNVGHTYMHRQAMLAVRQAGLVTDIGMFHAIRSGHAALASDMQEPFRHLVDHVVLEFLEGTPPSLFRRTPDGPFRIMLPWVELRQFKARMGEMLALSCIRHSASEPLSYRNHLWGQVRRLRRWLVDPDEAFEAFEHPWEVA